MKKIALSLVLAGFLISGCSKSDVKVDTNAVTFDSGVVSSKITIGSKLEPLSLNDQFDKPQQVDENTKRLVFVFKKDTGHTMREYFKTKTPEFIADNHIVMVADVSKMPSLIKEFVAIPDLQESKYSILLLDNEEFSKTFQNEANINKIMIVELDNLEVKKVVFLATTEQLDSYFH